MARDASGKSGSGASDSPPFAYIVKTTWSFLKSVGRSHTSTPLANRTTVASTSGTVRVDDTAAGSGFFSISSRVEVVSFHAVTATDSLDPSDARICSSVGTAIPAFCGDTASTTRLSSTSSVLAAVDTSAALIPGSSCWTSAYS